MTSSQDDQWPFASTTTANTTNEQEDTPIARPYVDPQSWSEWDHEFAQSTIESYLTNSLSPEETALALTTPVAYFVASGNAATDDTPDHFDIWDAMLATARDHSYDSPAIPALVALLAAIKEIPKSKQFKNKGVTYWTDLPHLGWQIRENWNRQVLEPEDYGDGSGWTCTAGQWASMNAFVAQFTIADISDYRTYCVWALRDALEDVPGQRSSVGHITNLDHFVPAAAVWIFVAGKVIYTEWLNWEVEESQIPGDKGGNLWDRRGFGPKRWTFWKERFDWVERQQEVEVKEETRELAKKAAQRMEEIEKTEVPRGGLDPLAVETQTRGSESVC